MTIQNALAEVQKKLVAPKDRFNKFGGYKYRSAEGIIEAVKPLLAESMITLSDEVVSLGGRNYVKATATFHFGGESFSACGYAREEEAKKGMDGSQITGAASSYARKYALNGLLLIDDGNDSDATNRHEVDTAAEGVDNRAKQVDTSPKQADKERLFTAEEADAVRIWAKELYKSADVLVPVLKKLGVEKVEQLPYSKRAELIKLGKEFAAEFKGLDEGAKNG